MGMTNYRNIVLLLMIIIFSCSAGISPSDAAAKNNGRKGEKSRQAGKELRKAKEAKETEKAEDPAGEKVVEKEGTRGEEKVSAREPETGENDLAIKDFKDEDFKPKVEEESSVWLFIKMILLLGIFGGGFYYFYRFVTKKTGMNLFGGEAIKVLSIVPLGQNKFLHVVDLAGKVLVIGVADSTINLISEITEKDQVDRIRILSSRTPPPDMRHGGFNDYISKQIGRIIDRIQEFKHRERKIRSAPVDNPADIEYLRLQRSRLKNLNGNPDE